MNENGVGFGGIPKKGFISIGEQSSNRPGFLFRHFETVPKDNHVSGGPKSIEIIHFGTARNVHEKPSGLPSWDADIEERTNKT